MHYRGTPILLLPQVRVALAILICLAALLLMSSPATAAPKGAVLLSNSDIFQTSHEGKLYTCGNLPPWSVGRMSGQHFYPTKKEISNLTSLLKKTRSMSKKKAYKKKIAALKKHLIAAKDLCADGTSSNPNFDSSGNVLDSAKATFGIPASMSANVFNGIAAWNRSCIGCHATTARFLGIKNMSLIADRIQLAPMNFRVPEEVSMQVLADITAYANY